MPIRYEFRICQRLTASLPIGQSSMTRRTCAYEPYDSLCLITMFWTWQCLRREYLLFPMTYDLCPMPLLFCYPMPHSFLTISCLERHAHLLSWFVSPVSIFLIWHIVSDIDYFLTSSHTISYLGDSDAFPWVVGIRCIKIGHVLQYRTEKKCPPQFASTLKFPISKASESQSQSTSVSNSIEDC